jgi:transposase
MRYELTDFEWAAIRSFLPNRPRGIPRVDDRRVLNGIFWVLRSGAPWRTCRKPVVPAPLAIIASFVGDRLVYGTGSWMPWPPVMTRLCR